MAHSGASTEVLIADDDQGCRDLIAEIVTEMGYIVVECDRADDALALVRQRRPSVVVLDVMLPDGDGFAVLDAIRQDPETADTGVLVCTAVLLEAVEHPLPREDRITSVVTKPFHVDTLIAALDRLLKAQPSR